VSTLRILSTSAFEGEEAKGGASWVVTPLKRT